MEGRQVKYRKFGKLDWEVSVLGFGVMRLPLLGEDPASVDEPEAIRMLRYAIDHGVNYLDSGYLYHAGKSEGIIAKALQDGYRERVRVATKLPARIVESEKDFDRYFNEQLGRLQTEKLDFYLLHGLNAESWHKLRDFGIIRWVEKKMAEGKFSHLGFSFHDDFEVFKEIIDAYDNWTLCQIQYNFMDENYQAGRRGVEYAAGKGLAIVVMEPLRGGKLARKPPKAVAKVWETAKEKRSPVEWALSWVWNQPEISVVLSGMSAMEQVVQNVEIAGRSSPGMLTAENLDLISRAREAYRGLIPVPCTGCGYCMPCPNGVEIPHIFQIYNDSIMYDDVQTGKMFYQSGMMLQPEQLADRCMECGECLEACPQSVPIPDWLKKVHELLGAE
jgi:predicted aldo/keto reductase-like oxidoreductase